MTQRRCSINYHQANQVKRKEADNEKTAPKRRARTQNRQINESYRNNFVSYNNIYTHSVLDVYE